VPQIFLGLAAAVALFVVLTLPSRSTHLGAIAPEHRIVFGGYHIHTKRSDGTGSADSIAEAASRAGLQFIILTDHGDGTRTPDPPQYRHGVLTIDAVEISTSGGHLAALGLRTAAPYPLAGEPRDVIEDVHRLGGWAVVAHPDSPKPALQWHAWNVPYDGVEWLNVDSEWRDESGAHLAATFARYFFRGPETIASLFQRPVQTLRRWDLTTRNRPVAGLAALDAHARLPWRTSNRGEGEGTLAALPSYRQMFRTLSLAAVLDRPLSGDATDDAARVLAALRAGRSFSVVTAIAAPGSLEFSATQNDTVVQMGEAVEPDGTPVSFQARVNDTTARLTLLHDGVPVATGHGRLEYNGSIAAGSYRVEAYRPGVSFPWIVSNPIYAGQPLAAPERATRPETATRIIALPAPAGWAIEHSETSTGSVTQAADATQFSFALGSGVPSSQFAALTSGLDAAAAQEGFDRVQFNVRADRPTRFSVQLRLGAGQRWRYSVYADETPRDVTAYLEDFQPAERTTSNRPIVARVRSVLFVIDTLNATPGTRGTVWLSHVGLGVGNTER
jgi:hypothetical protein